MFGIQENRENRKALIEKIANANVGAGVILASTDFDWTLARCILVLGKTPTVTLRDELLQPKTGLEGYKDIWKKEIASQSLTTLFDDWAKKNGLAPVNWSEIRTARDLRNYLVHGLQSNVEEEIGQAIINLLERACDILCAFAQSKEKDLFAKLTPRNAKTSQAKNRRIRLQRRFVIITKNARKLSKSTRRNPNSLNVVMLNMKKQQ